MSVPCIFPASREKLLFAKALFIIPMIIRPGAMKSAKGTPSTWRLAPPSARVKMTRNISVVTAGAQMVWSCTFMKRRTSLR